MPTQLFLAMHQAGLVSAPQVFHGTHACMLTYVRSGGPFGATQRLLGDVK